MRRVLSTIATLAISAACIVLIGVQVDLATATSVLSSLQPGALLVPVLITIVSLLFRPLRWQRSFPAPAPSLRTCFVAFSLGNLLNNVLPARGGDLLRCAMARPEAGLSSVSTVLATLALEKVLDGLAVVSVLTIAVLLSASSFAAGTLAYSGGALFLGAFVLLFAMARKPDQLWNWATRLLPLGTQATERIHGVYLKFVRGIAVVASARQMSGLIGLTAAYWLCDAAVTWGLAHALDARISLLQAGLVTGVIALGLMVPAAPAGIGTFEAASMMALSLCGIDRERAFALSVLMHLWTFTLTTLVGILCLWSSATSLPALVKDGNAPATRDEPKTHRSAA